MLQPAIRSVPLRDRLPTWAASGLLAASLLLLPAPVEALSVQSSSVMVDTEAGVAGFSLLFDAVPDFYTVDEFGRQASSFQYWIFWDGAPTVRTGDSDVIVRGGEIPVAGDLRFRDRGPSGTGGPDAGGWGPLRGSVPFVQTGALVEFSAPLSLIGDPDGVFAYGLIATEYGASSGTLLGYSGQVVPEPSTASLVALGLGLTALCARRPRI